MMTIALLFYVAGVLVVEFLGKSYEAQLDNRDDIEGVSIVCVIDDHTYVVSAPNCNLACQAWTAYAADPDCNFCWNDAVHMHRITRETFERIAKK